MGQRGQKNPAAFKMANPHSYGFEGKSLKPPRYDTTDRIPDTDSLHFGQHGGENPVAWIESTQSCPEENPH